MTPRRTFRLDVRVSLDKQRQQPIIKLHPLVGTNLSFISLNVLEPNQVGVVEGHISNDVPELCIPVPLVGFSDFDEAFIVGLECFGSISGMKPLCCPFWGSIVVLVDHHAVGVRYELVCRSSTHHHTPCW